MAERTCRGGLVLSLVMALAVFAGGCGRGDKQRADADAKKTQTASVDAKVKPGEDDTKHDGWWCDEHGIPEGECSMCSKKVADAFKAKGDWCMKHNRAQSQCFKCDPSLREQFAARYRAKYNGKEPPVPDDD